MRKNRVLGLNSQALIGAISQSWTLYKVLDGSVFLLCTSIRFPARWLQVLDLNGHKKAGTWSEDALSKSSLSSAGTWLCGTFSRHSLAGTFLALTPFPVHFSKWTRLRLGCQVAFQVKILTRLSSTFYRFPGTCTICTGLRFTASFFALYMH